MIGVFDSGHGGLTVLRGLVNALPERHFVYLGDHAHAPYGSRDAEEIHALTVRNVERLFGLGCRLVLLACNTASAVALRRMQRTWLPGAGWPGHNVIGVLVPMVEAITRVPWMVEAPPAGMPAEPRTVGVFATARTVDSGAYPREIAKRAHGVRVVQQACPELAARIEEGAEPAALRPLIRDYVAGLLDQLGGERLDTVVLGCTHYPLVADLFAEMLPQEVEVLCQPTLVARSLAAYLERHPEYAAPLLPAPVAPRFHTTGRTPLVSDLGSRFFGRPITFRTIADTR